MTFQFDSGETPGLSVGGGGMTRATLPNMVDRQKEGQVLTQDKGCEG